MLKEKLTKIMESENLRIRSKQDFTTGYGSFRGFKGDVFKILNINSVVSIIVECERIWSNINSDKSISSTRFTLKFNSNDEDIFDRMFKIEEKFDPDKSYLYRDSRQGIVSYVSLETAYNIMHKSDTSFYDNPEDFKEWINYLISEELIVVESPSDITIIEMVKNKDFINAMKAYRAARDCTLTEARSYIEALQSLMSEK